MHYRVIGASRDKAARIEALTVGSIIESRIVTYLGIFLPTTRPAVPIIRRGILLAPQLSGQMLGIPAEQMGKYVISGLITVYIPKPKFPTWHEG